MRRDQNLQHPNEEPEPMGRFCHMGYHTVPQDNTIHVADAIIGFRSQLRENDPQSLGVDHPWRSKNWKNFFGFSYNFLQNWVGKRLNRCENTYFGLHYVKNHEFIFFSDKGLFSLFAPRCCCTDDVFSPRPSESIKTLIDHFTSNNLIISSFPTVSDQLY